MRSYFDYFLFDDANPFLAESVTSHKHNIKETGDSWLLYLSAPGLKKEDFKLSLSNRDLTVSYDVDPASRDITFLNAKKYSKSWTLPINSDVELITAVYEQGILRVTIPKSGKAKRREITVS
jgi:HSP20 family protein